MMLASLPPGGWHTGWVRDATYALVALARTGHSDEAKAGLDFFLDADAGRYRELRRQRQPYRISDRSLLRRRPGRGRLLGLADAQHRDRRLGPVPVGRAHLRRLRAADTAWLIVDRRRRATPSTTRSRAASPSRSSRTSRSSGMAIADASIWEVHWGNRQHFLYTTATAARGLCDMATLARRAGKTDDVERYRMLAEKVTTAMKQNFVDSNSVLAGSLERLAQGANYRDGATVEAITWSLIPATDTIATRDARRDVVSADARRRLQARRGLAAISTTPTSGSCIDLRASAAFRRAGNAPKADQLLDWVTGAGVARTTTCLPELYNTRTSARSDRRVLRLDPDGRLRRRRVPADDARSRPALRAQRLRREGPRRVSRRGPRAARRRRHRQRRRRTSAAAPASRARAAAARARRAMRCCSSSSGLAHSQEAQVSTSSSCAASARTFPGVRALNDVSLAIERGRGARARRRERRRQVDADQDPRRRLPGGQLQGRSRRRRRRRRRSAVDARCAHAPASPSCTRSCRSCPTCRSPRTSCSAASRRGLASSITRDARGAARDLLRRVLGADAHARPRDARRPPRRRRAADRSRSRARSPTMPA